MDSIKIPGNAADLPKKKEEKKCDTIPIMIDGCLFEKPIKEAVDIALTILTIASSKLDG